MGSGIEIPTMRIDISKKYAFAMRRNWSHNDFGNQVYHVYLVVVITFAGTFEEPSKAMDRTSV